MVRAKMYLESVTHRKWGSEVRLQVVTRGEDNKRWSAATPTGSLTLTIKNEAALGEFTLEQLADGQEFYVDIAPVPAALLGEEGMGD